MEIGFEQVRYSVDESGGQVTLVVRVLSGELSGQVPVRVTTAIGTAEGM